MTSKTASAIPVLSYDELLKGLPAEVMAAAVRAALSFHEPEHSSFHGGLVCQCRDKGGQRYLWPCPEVRRMVAVLGGGA